MSRVTRMDTASNNQLHVTKESMRTQSITSTPATVWLFCSANKTAGEQAPVLPPLMPLHVPHPSSHNEGYMYTYALIGLLQGWTVSSSQSQWQQTCKRRCIASNKLPISCNSYTIHSTDMMGIHWYQFLYHCTTMKVSRNETSHTNKCRILDSQQYNSSTNKVNHQSITHLSKFSFYPWCEIMYQLFNQWLGSPLAIHNDR